MNTTLSLDALIKRDRWVVLSGVFGITLIAWWYMAVEARAMAATGVCECFGLKMTGPDMKSWGAVEFIALFLMWAEMMVAMMAPSVSPMLLTFASVNRKRRERGGPYVGTAIFLLGYIIIWTLFSLVAAAGQWILHRNALLSPMMVSANPLLGGTLLIAAGAFQWSPWKRSCLTHCQTPLQFVMSDWREGRVGALIMGLKHGTYCTGCCWLLMALLFVAGVMNLVWIALISAFVLVEKFAGINLGRITGVFLGAWGIWMLLQSM